jgi:hypothetical protein
MDNTLTKSFLAIRSARMRALFNTGSERFNVRCSGSRFIDPSWIENHNAVEEV